MMDASIKGRMASGDKNGQHLYPERTARGEKNGAAILTEKDVLEIREIGLAVSQRDLAKQFGVNKTTISSILWRETWKHI